MIDSNHFQIHYYFSDDSHAMDAFVRNKCETELLAVFQEACSLLGTSLKIESLPLDEGGLREFWKVYGENSTQINTTLAFLAVLLSGLTLVSSRIPFADPEKDAREKTIQELTIEEKNLIIEEKRLALEKLRQEIKAGAASPQAIEKAAKGIETNLKIQSRRSNFYKQLDEYKKVTAVGFSTSDSYSNEVVREHLVSRIDFKKYVIVDNNLPTESNDAAVIEIVAPVLREGNYKWKGLYDGKPISFSMLDTDFRNSVLQEQVSFKHGSRITCVLNIQRKVDEIGEIEITGYSVVTVLDKTDGGVTEETSQGRKYRAHKKFNNDQHPLF